MCFYVKRHLDYKPYAIPSYVLTRETEAAREKEIEQEKERARNKELEDALLATVWFVSGRYQVVVLSARRLHSASEGIVGHRGVWIMCISATSRQFYLAMYVYRYCYVVYV